MGSSPVKQEADTRADSAPQSRIVGGTPTTIYESPYMVALLYHFPATGLRVQRCVGSLISSWHVLTSAYCYTGAVLSNIEVRAGSTHSMAGGSVVTISEVIKHPDYQQRPRSADIAVAVLATPLPISSDIDILYLPPQGINIPDGQSLKVVGWGFESLGAPQLETLKTINLNKVSLDECQAIYGEQDNVVIDNSVICASEEGQVGTCHGDSGAPLVMGNLVVGLSSYFQECGDAVHPDVFTSIDHYTNWILEVAVAPRTSPNVARSTPIVL
ncbi:trypsin beta-like [Battus philenor]|uniref:trypsin beta-like n=1 Tax=Battus philenor TaxID=42288 RepID=UPI0035D03ACD